MNGLLIAGGGTGGHIYPAISIAQALKKKRPDLQIDFVGTNKGLEAKIVPREKFPLHFVNVGALNSVHILTKITTLLSLPIAVFQGAKLILRLRPKYILGVGGYASGPVMVAAVLLRPFISLHLAIFEANAMPGMTNRWLSRAARVAFTNFDVSNKYFKHPLTVGIPIREGLFPQNRGEHRSFRILIFGGSQGARGINTTVVSAIENGGSWLDGVEIVHQIGSTDFKKFDAIYNKIKPQNISWFEFLYDMPDRYKWADLVFCRAGASTLAELAATHKAAVLIPFPYASDNHQQENAEAIAKENGAVMVLQKDFTPERFVSLVEEYKTHPSRLSEFEDRIGKFFRPQSAEFVQKFHPDLLLLESGGDNLAAHFSRELADYTIYVIDVAGGDKIPRKGGPGITQSDLLVINKTDLAGAVGADLSVMERDARQMRGRGPFVFAQVKHGVGVDHIKESVIHHWQHASGIAHHHS